MEGKVYTDKGFISSSLNKRDAERWLEGIQMHRKKSETAFVTVRVPKGSRAMPVRPISSNPEENEMLLDAGSRFKVIQARQRTKVSQWEVILEMIP
jgi:hypothetical protein